MAKKGKGKGLKIRTVKSKEDRRRPSVFLRLKTDESFKGVALFEPDPELDNNPGYYEYYDHFDKQGNSYVPCSGDSCPFCAANDNPSTRALTVWYFPEAGDAKDQLKVFTMNYGTVTDISDEAEEEDGLLGKKLRIKRLDDRGGYKVRVLNDKPLAKGELKKLMKALEEKFPDGLEGLVLKQLKTQMERLKALDALEDDDDDDDEDTKGKSKARRGKAVDDDDDDDDDDDETAGIEGEQYEILKVSKKNGTITVEHDDEKVEMSIEESDADISDFSKGDTVTIDAEYDDDDEVWNITSISAEDEAEADDDDDDDDDEDDDEAEASSDDDDDDDDDEASVIEGVEYEVVKFQEKDEIFDLKNDDGKVKMWVGDGVDVEPSEVKKGTTVTVDAEQDDEGDWIVTSLEVAKAKGGKKGKSKAKK